MITFHNLCLTGASEVLCLSLKSGEKQVVVMPDQASSDGLIDCLNGERAPQAGSISLPEPEQYHVVTRPDEVKEDQKLKAVLTQPYQRLLTSLRKYEQLSIQMSKHFSPFQLQGYMEEMEDLEQLINQYEAWELESDLKTWQKGLQIQDLSVPYKEAEPDQQWAVILSRAFVMPTPLTILKDPLPWLNEKQRDFLLQQMTELSAGWLVLSTYNSYSAWPEAYWYTGQEDC